MKPTKYQVDDWCEKTFKGLKDRMVLLNAPRLMVVMPFGWVESDNTLKSYTIQEVEIHINDSLFSFKQQVYDKLDMDKGDYGMEKQKCPDCGCIMRTKIVNFDEETQSEQYETYCPMCSLSYRWWDGEFDDEDEFYDGVDDIGGYDVCPQCGGNIMVKVNSDGTQIENICEDCSYYSVDVE